MIYSLTLGPAFLLAGAVLLILGGLALLQPQATEKWLLAFPRSRGWGVGLLIAAALWSFYLVATIDLGEFDKYRSLAKIAIPIAAILTAVYVDELLSARALGMLVLLAAEPLLEAAFLRPELSRLFLVTFTFVAIVFSMFWIGMPYVLRDHLRWLTALPLRLRALSAFLAGYGLLLLILGLTLRRSA
jgi:hypothetical protein